MRKGIIFNNKRIIKPGAYGKVDASGQVGYTIGDQKVVALVGKSAGGEPGKVLYFDDPESAKKVLKGGDLYQAVDLAFNPTKTGGAGAGRIAVVRVGNPVSASLTKNGMVITATDKGTWTNGIKVSVTDGSIPATKSVALYDSSTDSYSFMNNIGAIMTIVGETASIEVTEGLLTAKVGAETVGTVDLTDPRFNALRTICEKVTSLHDGITLAIVPGTSSEIKASHIDLGTYNPTTPVMAYAKDLALRCADNGLVTITGSASANFDYTSLTKGADGTPPASWVQYFDKLTAKSIGFVVPLTDDEGIIGEVAAHVDYMSDEKQKKRQAVVGVGEGTSLATTIDLASSISHPRVQIVLQGCYARVGAKVETLPAYMLAVMHAGMASYLKGESCTFKFYNIIDLVKELDEDSMKNAIENGILVFENVDGEGIRLVADWTTYTDSEESLYTERAVVTQSDILSDRVNETLERAFVGKKSSKGTATSAVTLTGGILKNAVDAGEIFAFKEVTATYHDRRVDVKYKVAPADPINYVTVSASYYTEDAVSATYE